MGEITGIESVQMPCGQNCVNPRLAREIEEALSSDSEIVQQAGKLCSMLLEGKKCDGPTEAGSAFCEGQIDRPKDQCGADKPYGIGQILHLSKSVAAEVEQH